MLNKYNEIFNYASLARSSYANFANLVKSDDVEGIKEAIVKYDESNSFSEIVAKKYDVIAHWKDRAGNDFSLGNVGDIFSNESGFSGTLFHDKTNHGFVMAFKGTAGWKDLLGTDVADIVTNGAAHNQIIDMYNFWQQIKHSGQESYYEAAYLDGNNPLNVQFKLIDSLPSLSYAAKKAALLPLKIKAVNEGYYVADGGIYKVAFRPSNEIYKDERKFTYKEKIDVSKMTVAGHSLGGHLAAIFSRLFPEVTSMTYMFNGAGTGGKLSLVPAMFDGISANDNVNNLLDGLAKGYSNFERDKIYNLTGDKGMNLVAIDKDWAFQGRQQ
jgi:outer membrane adhesin like proteiin